MQNSASKKNAEIKFAGIVTSNGLIVFFTPLYPISCLFSQASNETVKSAALGNTRCK